MDADCEPVIRWMIAVVALVALVAPGAALAADTPTLGATVPASVYANDSRTMMIRNDSTVPTTATVEPSGGWGIAPASLDLQPGETGTVQVTGEGEDGSALNVLVAATSVPAGMDKSQIKLVAHVYHDRPPEPVPWLLYGLVALVALLIGAGIVRRHWPRAVRQHRGMA